MPAPSPSIETAEPAGEIRQLRGDLLTIATRISHDLRTPIGSITTTCDMLKELAAENQPAAPAMFDSVFRSSDEIARLLERVSFVLKATANPEPKQPTPMSGPVSAALQRLERRIGARGATVHQPATWPVVAGVARWLEVVWWNLVANALQHGRETPSIGLDWRDSPAGVYFWVEDDGIGVSAEVRKRLFQPFDTLHKTNSTRGIGLAIVRRLVELQGGACGYEHTNDRARFFFTLPGPCLSNEK